MRTTLIATLLTGGLFMTESALAQAKPEIRFTGGGGGDKIVGQSFATRAPVIGQHGMAATAQPLATQIAIDVLKAGGSAVDAAIAANAALGLMEPVGCGIGGDLYAIVWDPKTRKLYGYNGSGRSPMGRSYAQMKAKLNGKEYIPALGALSVTVPGAVDGWFALHGKFGKLPMRKVLAPATSYARDGFPVSQLIAYYWDRNMRGFDRIDYLEERENAKRTYLIDGKAPAQGDIFRNPNLAATYDRLAREGRDAFYQGHVARTSDAYFKRIGGDLRFEDFAAHTGTWVEPVSIRYRGVDVYELPPNTQGVAALQILQMVERFDLKSMGRGSADATMAMVEAKRLAFEDVAAYYADMDKVNVPLKGLVDPRYAAARSATIDLARANPNVGPGEPKLRENDTTYLTVADKDGMMVSLIQSNFRGMGSGLVADGLGFMFQNRGELFSMNPAHANVYAPGKRPFQTIIPAFAMKDGQPWLSFGVMGGDMQPQGHAQIIVNMVDFGLNVQEAGDAARWRHDGGSEATGQRDGTPGTVELESGFPAETARELGRRGFNVTNGAGGYGGYQAIQWDPLRKVYFGASEMRKDGAAIGY
jgi:gamma-glutamyltranspeptidase / glutathione hydrolase